MWPWEHLAVGYVLFSLAYRHFTGRVPTDAAAIAVIVGTQFPDLVDKPLAWTFDVLQSGVSVAHSVFVATMLSVVVLVVARRVGRPDVGAGFVVGYLAHIPADVIYPLILGRDVAVRAFFWPLFVSDGGGVGGGFLANFTYYLGEFLEFLATPRGMTFLAIEATLLAIAAWIWIADGYPGLPLPSRVRRWV